MQLHDTAEAGAAPLHATHVGSASPDAWSGGRGSSYSISLESKQASIVSASDSSCPGAQAQPTHDNFNHCDPGPGRPGQPQTPARRASKLASSAHGSLQACSAEACWWEANDRFNAVDVDYMNALVDPRSLGTMLSMKLTVPGSRSWHPNAAMVAGDDPDVEIANTKWLLLVSSPVRVYVDPGFAHAVFGELQARFPQVRARVPCSLLP